MKRIQEVGISPRSAESFASILGADAIVRIREMARTVRENLDGRVIWNINSTAAGGGVAEMLHSLLSYARGLDVDTRWLVITGTPEFFRVTKRVHNALHGERGDGSPLGDYAAAVFRRVTEDNACELDGMIRPRDIVILHDPQTAGLIPHLTRRGVSVVWRCHIGNDIPCEEADLAWQFLEPYLKEAHAFIFSRFAYLPDVLYHGRCMVAAPSIDPFSPKNQEMSADTVRSILVHLGLVGGPNGSPRTYMRSDGTRASVERRGEVIREGEPPQMDVPLVVQVSRWDRLKDPIGVLEGFSRAMNLSGADHAELALVGPTVAAVADDPEGAEVFQEVLARWKTLPGDQRRRVHLINLPMDDLQENAAMVNALQRHAAVVVQKSLREGFGLTVTEAMWKSKPVIASAVGGIRDQVEHGVSGLLLKNPRDLDAFAGSVMQVLANTGFAERLGVNAKRRATQNYLGLNIVAHYDDLIARLDHERPDRNPTYLADASGS